MMLKHVLYGIAGGIVLLLLIGCQGSSNTASTGSTNAGSVTVLGYNDLGMHCMSQDFSEMMILPPYNTVHAQVIDRSGEDPRIITSGVTVSYTIPGNTTSIGKTNFWTYANALLGFAPAPNVGLTGNGLSGTMTAQTNGDWAVTGIPITPLTDANQLDSYQLSGISVTRNGAVIGSTQAVVPVSWEMSCNLCHNTPGISTATDILRAHDRLQGTTLENAKPVLCGSCHQQAPLGALAPGKAGVPTLSRSMHSVHASRMAPVLAQLGNNACYACHPGIDTKCLRDVHYSNGITCVNCHESMTAVASETRRPWVDEPRCATCHTPRNPSFQYEEAGKLYRDSRGHHGVTCAACHGSPHAITPTVIAADNVQAIAAQGFSGTIRKCTVCHSEQPDDSFPHRLSGGD